MVGALALNPETLLKVVDLAGWDTQDLVTGYSRESQQGLGETTQFLVLGGKRKIQAIRESFALYLERPLK